MALCVAGQFFFVSRVALSNLDEKGRVVLTYICNKNSKYIRIKAEMWWEASLPPPQRTPIPTPPLSKHA